jgi:hypothetical protein
MIKNGKNKALVFRNKKDILRNIFVIIPIITILFACVRLESGKDLDVSERL